MEEKQPSKINEFGEISVVKNSEIPPVEELLDNVPTNNLKGLFLKKPNLYQRIYTHIARNYVLPLLGFKHRIVNYFRK